MQLSGTSLDLGVSSNNKVSGPIPASPIQAPYPGAGSSGSEGMVSQVGRCSWGGGRGQLLGHNSVI